MTSSKPSESPTDFPTDGRIAAIDYGTVRIGIAVCDPAWILASPLEVRPAANWRDDGDYYRSLLKVERVAAFIVGLPIHCDGGESQKSLEARKFARWLADEVGVPVRMFDERFTTADAKNRMTPGGFTRKKKKNRIDAVAAQVLLESFLEACRYRDEVAGVPVDSEPVGGDDISQ
ncbi:MAG: Holliday junction resolvase RuvX [Rubripirellula sp.]|nr:Holliday junction resolvase RuvX [Rubripirellula sp.]